MRTRTVRVTNRFFVVYGAIVLMVVLVAGISLVRVSGQIDRLRIQYGEQLTLKTQVTEEVAEQQHRYEMMDSDHYIQSEAREKLGLIKEGEIRYDPAS